MEVFSGLGGDGAHWGLTDLYDDYSKALDAAIASGKPFDTGWYASKKEIVTGRITGDGKGNYTCEASVSDDFDTEGYGSATITSIPLESARDAIEEALYQAWDEAEDSQKENRLYRGFSIHNERGWVETYIQPLTEQDEPPGDNYHKWGFQGEEELSDEEKEAIETWIYSYPEDQETLTVGKFTVRSWDYEEGGVR